VDAVLTDLRMPGRDGVELIERVRSLQPHVKIFAISAYATEPLRRYLREQGVLQCIPKPFQLSEVLDMLRSSLDPDAECGSKRCTRGGSGAPEATAG
jgi:CheY-like chemotaxis protein